MADKVLDALLVVQVSLVQLVLTAEEEWHDDACDETDEMMHKSAELLREVSALKEMRVGR